MPYTLIAQTKIDSLISELDRYIDNKSYYTVKKETKITEIKNSIARTSANSVHLLSLYSYLFDEYQSYKYDSAYVYAGKILEIATKLNDPVKIVEAKEHIAFCFLSSGLFKESFDIVNTIDIKNHSSKVRIEYYNLVARLYYDMADYNGEEPFRSKYVKLGNQYSDSAMALLPADSQDLWAAAALKRMKLKDFSGAIDAFSMLLHSNKTTDHTYAIAASSLGYIYSLEGNKNQAMHYLILASIADIKSATKETVALRGLATLFYRTGNISRANKYIKLAMEDANFYNARHRKIEISSILPIIEKERFDSIEKQKNRLMMYGLLVSALFVLLFVTTIVIYKQMRKLKTARRIIQEQNKKLTTTNTDLLEANRIKDEYIGHFFYINSEYIDKIENIYKMVNRKVAGRQFDDLRTLFKDSDLKKERENMYTSFDQTFLKIFPDFVKEYNKLFAPQDHSIPEGNNYLTSEMRIFALIRLGINESERIAKFLNYSVNTINTYKTKVKNKSWAANEQFEQEIMKIKSVKSDL